MNLLTFDVEDWFHILDHKATLTEKEWINYPSRVNKSVDRILNLLSENNICATFFCLGWIAEHYPEVIRRIDSMGHEIASHSYSHQLVSGQKFNEVQTDIQKSVYLLENLTSKKVKAYRAPGFSMTRNTPWLIEILSENGIEFDCSFTSANHSHGGEKSFNGNIPQLVSYRGISIKEFPLNSFNFRNIKILYSGGGYFRLLPYWLISMLVKRTDYVMTYFHPRDFDPDQPKIPDLSFVREFKSYYGLSTSYNKLSKLLDDFDFVSVSEADKRIDWNSVPNFSLN